MDIVAHYLITLRHPKIALKLKDDTGRSRKRNCIHRVIKARERGGFRRLNLIEELAYRLSHYKKSDELSFDCNYQGLSQFNFQIGRNSKLVFAKKPFSFDNEDHVSGVIRNGDKNAQFTIRGLGEMDSAEIEYAINYVDPLTEETFVHDPIIRNGSGIPFLPPDRKFEVLQLIRSLSDDEVMEFLKEIEDLAEND